MRHIDLQAIVPEEFFDGELGLRQPSPSPPPPEGTPVGSVRALNVSPFRLGREDSKDVHLHRVVTEGRIEVPWVSTGSWFALDSQAVSWGGQSYNGGRVALSGTAGGPGSDAERQHPDLGDVWEVGLKISTRYHLAAGDMPASGTLLKSAPPVAGQGTWSARYDPPPLNVLDSGVRVRVGLKQTIRERQSGDQIATSMGPVAGQSQRRERDVVFIEKTPHDGPESRHFTWPGQLAYPTVHLRTTPTSAAGLIFDLELWLSLSVYGHATLWCFGPEAVDKIDYFVHGGQPGGVLRHQVYDHAMLRIQPLAWKV